MADLWVLAGQSNMEGCGTLTNVEPPVEHVRMFAHGDEWKCAEEPLHTLIHASDIVHHGLAGEELTEARRSAASTPRTRGGGLGLPFAKAVYAQTGIAIDLLPAAHGGTSMEQWSPAKKDMGGASLYGAMLRRCRLALETNPDTRLRGVLWYQGESDANPAAAAVYAERMTELIGAIRRDFDAPDLPFFFVQLGTFAQSVSADPSGAVSWSRIREMQRTLPETVPHTAVAPALDLELDDAIHIGTQGLKRLGKRLANIALNRVYSKNTPSGILFQSVTREGANTLRVSYAGVSVALRTPDPAGRVFGFGIEKEGMVDSSIIWKAVIDPQKPTDVLIHVGPELPPGTPLWYGYGFDPICQLTDEADMAVPAMGPIPLP